MEILFALGIGALIFGEKQNVREIAPGAVVMLAGVVLLSLAARGSRRKSHEETAMLIKLAAVPPVLFGAIFAILILPSSVTAQTLPLGNVSGGWL